MAKRDLDLRKTIKVEWTSWAREWACAKPIERERRFELRESGGCYQVDLAVSVLPVGLIF